MHTTVNLATEFIEEAQCLTLTDLDYMGLRALIEREKARRPARLGRKRRWEVRPLM